MTAGLNPEILLCPQIVGTMIIVFEQIKLRCMGQSESKSDKVEHKL